MFHDFTNRLLPERGCYLPPITPHEAGARLARIASAHAFTMYEHFLTDLAGHDQDMTRAVEVLENLEGLLDSVLAHLDLSANVVVLTSDHGNCEDLSTKRHTLNPVPTLLWGQGTAEFAATIQDLSGIARAILVKNLTLTGGVIYYALDSNNSPYDSIEVYGGFGYKLPWFEFGFAAYREVSHFPGWYLMWYLSRSFELPFAGASLDLWSSWSAEISDDKAVFPTSNGSYYRGLNAGHLMATLNFPVGKYLKISPKLMYWYALGGQSTYVLNNLSWDRKHNHLLGGVSITTTF